MKDLKNLSVVKVLETSSSPGLGRGNLGVVMARAGVGKTACLIHIAMYKLLQGEKFIHISLDNPPEKVTSYYRVIFSELVKALDIRNEQEIKTSVEKHRMILSYLNQSFQIQRLKEYLKNLREKVVHFPDDCGRPRFLESRKRRLRGSAGRSRRAFRACERGQDRATARG